MFNLENDLEHSFSTIYGLNYKGRALSSLKSEESRSIFLIGTTSLNNFNEIHMIEVTEESENLLQVTQLNVFPHENEIWDISTSPENGSLMIVTYNKISENGTTKRGTVYNIDYESSKLSPIYELPVDNIQCTDFHPVGRKFASLDINSLQLWNISESSVVKDFEFNIVDNLNSKNSISNESKFTNGSWDPHFTNRYALIEHSDIHCVDIKSNQVCWSVNDAHSQLQVRDIDFNPYKPYNFCSGGDDCSIALWDYRKCNKPINRIQHHSHWVWNVKYNPNHDQLLLSSSTDSFVHLWNIEKTSSSSPSSSSKITEEMYNTNLIKTYDEHEDSVYSLCWSNADPWIFISLSYDGRAVVSSVPNEEQDKILLSET
eukprot:TRINITY_DN1091_c0_g1_i1.p1 TRINITY_DN1091_c0_g1~~TRINITY_DN1091_c0_g1_i1.p1  ORF type:complete len:373 (-),score=73.71 TRINITY_DN1091_c0_g1_i1:42-1160(-)